MGLVLFRLLRSFNRIDRPLWLFLAMVACTILLLVIDSVFWLVDRQPALAWVNWTVNLLYFFIQPLVPWLWMVYTMEYIPGFPGKPWQRLLVSGIPAMFHGLQVAVTPWTGWMFSIDAQGVYSRGPLFWLAISGAFVYLVCGMGLVLIYRRRILPRIRQPLFGFGLLPGLAAAAQSMVYGIAVIWPAIAFSLLVIYLWVEGEMQALDYLTGLQNRRSLHRYLDRRLKEAHSGKGVGALMIDVDDFKAINDTWGHQAGDQALRLLARNMRNCFHHHDFIARYAGDEFVVVLDVDTPQDLEAAAARFKSRLAELGRGSTIPWTLRVSVGAGFFNPASTREPDQVNHFLDQIDQAMYQDKAGKSTRR